MHKNVQTNPEKSQKFRQHSCLFYVDTRKKLKAIRGNGYRFVPKGGTFPTENHHACCEKHIPKPTPIGTKFVRRHVDAAP